MTLDGRIVEYLENGKFLCAFVLEDNGSRLRLLNQNSRELNLPLNRIVHFTKEKIVSNGTREDIISILQDTSKQREGLIKFIALDEIWELVSEKPDDTFEGDFLATLFFGEDASDDQSAAFLRSVIANRLYFKYKAGKIHAHSPETVEQITLQQEKEKQQENFIINNSSALLQIWEGDENAVAWKDRDATLQLLRDYYLFGKEADEYDLARKLIKNAQLTGPHDIFHLLVKAGMWNKNENIPLLKQDIPTFFSAAALSEVEEIKLPTGADLPETRRKDFRDLPVLTIDGPSTRDFDDGLHIEKQGENYLVGIHISDVGLYVKQGTALFDAALQRGTSIYFPEKPLSMLPTSLSEDKLSLIKDQERPAVSFLVLLSPTAEILRFELVHSIVSVKRQLTYQEADRLVKEDQELAAMSALSKLLRQRRVNNGALLLPMPDLNINIMPDGTIGIKTSDAETPSRVLVAELMILANTLGAQFVAEREAPGLFRCQPEPRQRLIDGFENDILKVLQQRKRLSPMSLLTTPKKHSGVGAPQYTTVTSPIRRLLDLVMQLQISHIIRGKGVLFSKKDMKHFGSIILATLGKANQVRHLRQRYWILKYLETKTGDRLPALVIESGPKRVQIFLEDFLLDMDLPQNPVYNISAGDTVMIKLSKVNALGNILKLEW